MAENILKLKKRAVAAGMPKADAMKADRAKLDAFLAGEGNGSKKKSTATKAVKKAVAKKKATGTKAPAEKKSAKTGKAKRPSSAPARKAQSRKPAARGENNGAMGRLSIDKSSIDWTAESDDWNPKKGGPVEKLFKALKKSKGNIDKAYEIVKDNPYDFVGKTKRDGTKRTKAEVEAMLRYRLNRTLYEFAKRTGQHESADASNRAAYGTGEYATVRKAGKSKPKSTKKASTKKGSTKAKASTTKKTGKKKAGKK